MLQHAAACAMLAIELVAEVSPSELVLDDLCIGANLTALKQSYCQPLYSAVHDMSVKHGVVVGPTGASIRLMPEYPTGTVPVVESCHLFPHFTDVIRDKACMLWHFMQTSDAHVSVCAASSVLW